MDIITDLTTRAVAFITVLQDIVNQDINNVIDKRYDEQGRPAVSLKESVISDIPNLQKKGIADIIWTSKSTSTIEEKIPLFIHFSDGLLAWLDTYIDDIEYKTPYAWRNKIRDKLYSKPDSRISLVNALHYMPLQVVIALTYKKDLPGQQGYDQRLYQVWQSFDYYKDKRSDTAEVTKNVKILTGDEEKSNITWWVEAAEKFPGDNNSSQSPRYQLALDLLNSDQTLLERLKKVEATLPFESIFNEELNEISKSRDKRYPDLDQKLKKPGQQPGDTPDPMKRGQEMELCALAFSGGGIRSATFNLGILQKLAESDNILPRIDYLSTVSGGGYIGTWFASWIQRSGSVHKVAERLNHKKSGDPMAEEVRPIRWLRMFSNYLAPNAGLMSTDSWTIGMTWLRNTIINQVILFLALLTFLSGLDFLFYLWSFLFTIKNDASPNRLYPMILSGILLVVCGVLAGIGMRRYYIKTPLRNKFFIKWYENVPSYLIALSVLTAYLLSSRFTAYHEIKGLNEVKMSYGDYFCGLKWAGVLGFATMLTAAYAGKYNKYRGIKTENEPKPKELSKKDQVEINFYIIFSSAIAAVAGMLLLAGIWELLHCLQQYSPDPCFVSQKKVFECCDLNAHYVWRAQGVTLAHFGLKLDYVIGVPLILELLACCVVIRMAIMGIWFPDERREWWGRLGAITHQVILVWVVITSAVLLLPYAIQYILNSVNFIKLLGGWGVIIGAGVKFAFSSKDTTGKETNTTGKIINGFIAVVPYVFMLGFLLLGAYAINYLNEVCFKFQHRVWFIEFIPQFAFMIPCLALTIILGLATVGLGYRVGVNEFSLHHFYRNRLVRAYMGATRSRANRDKTVNKFTNFDNADDISLKNFQTQEDYFGPLPILNTALNSSKNQELDRQDRKAESFVFTPLYCGFDFSLTRSAATAMDQVYEYGYRPTGQYAYPEGPSIGTAMAISGAAVNPNWGYHSSPGMAFLLTLFNVRLGWWMGNPRKKTWKSSDPKLGLLYLFNDLMGDTDIDADYVCLSDGGHFDNMGLYELIRRKCHFIILGDGEEDDDSSFEGLANAMRRCRIDFGVEIEFEKEIDNMIPEKENSDIVKSTLIQGTIKYPGDIPDGKLIYIKTRITKNISTDIRQYNMTHKDFPEQSTADQFFSEDQFESYRKLGYDAINETDMDMLRNLFK